MAAPLKLGVLGSTKGTDLQAIIDAINDKTLDAKIEVVISNKSNAYILTRSKKYKIPYYFIPHNEKTRACFDSEISAMLSNYNVELVLLIGFMRILSAKFCEEWKGKILNVHPSLLPKYAGGMDSNIHEEVIRSGDTETGCTIHFVTDTLDAGPILIQKKCAVDQDDSPESLKLKVQTLEGRAFIKAINHFINKNKY